MSSDKVPWDWALGGLVVRLVGLCMTVVVGDDVLQTRSELGVLRLFLESVVVRIVVVTVTIVMVVGTGMMKVRMLLSLTIVNMSVVIANMVVILRMTCLMK